ncbi:MAG: D-alanyl-D-alanine dipeptidase [Chitinophagaceae bacterium]|nr:D-alanyl-D-alanine dipeptidase [Chitinophagaceae bacterium]
MSYLKYKKPVPRVLTADSSKHISDNQLDTGKSMVSLTKYLQPLICDWKYATKDNFTGQVLYTNPEAFLRLPAAKALRAVQEELKLQNLSLKIFDAYRPYSVTKMMWEIVQDERYTANPAKGSGHNRGAAVDVSIVNLTTRVELPMPTPYDDFSEKAHHDYMKLDSAQLHNRKLLRNVMEKHGFVALETEWWHYYLRNPEQFELLDLDFDEMRKLTSK